MRPSRRPSKSLSLALLDASRFQTPPFAFAPVWMVIYKQFTVNYYDWLDQHVLFFSDTAAGESSRVSPPTISLKPRDNLS